MNDYPSQDQDGGKTMTTAPAPGPYRVHKTKNATLIQFIDHATWHNVASVTRNGADEATAALLAAAPKLLAALQETASSLDAMLRGENGPHETALTHARAAIEEATQI